MRIMSSEEAAYVAGIIDGEGYLEFGWRKRIRRERKGSPTYDTLTVRLEVPQVDGRLIDYLIKTTAEGARDMKHYPTKENRQDQHRWRVGFHGVYRILKQVYPFLIVKQKKAKEIIDYYDKKFLEKINRSFSKHH